MAAELVIGLQLVYGWIWIVYWDEICYELHMAGQVCANAKVPSVSFIRRFSPHAPVQLRSRSGDNYTRCDAAN